ncbi:unnamed protein product [Adineta steineri]|uniref:ADP ribosyltransferase domain-containing protein n=1 Tax=Adineta steineri TaxID=433720 RepID=A0A814TXW9_9BILA|nr:unnamed protein product [Adineta steineri]CAF1229452.1 unnamed protein product [Adineta steineri]
MNGEKSTTNASVVSKDADDRRRTNLQQVQNVLLIWLDSNIDETNDDCQNTIIKLRRAVNNIKTYTNGDQCLEFIQTIIDKKVCMIISGSLGQHIVPRVHNMSQVDSIFIFTDNQKHHDQWVKDWPKIKGVFKDIAPICETLKEAAHQREQNAIPISFMGLNKKLDQLDPSFTYTQTIKEILLTIKFGQNHIQDYIGYCRDAFEGNTKEIENVKQLEGEYHNKTPVYWYTCQMFLYPMLNHALRLMDGNIIMRMGFFIGDLYRQIQQLHHEQYAGTTAANTFTVYRGQGLSTGDFEQMSKIKGGIISFNNFLSTSKDRELSYAFAENNQANPDLVGILFVMEVDPSRSTTSFASIAGISKFQEEEVLFSMNSVFRILNITPMSENNRLYEVNLVLTADNDPEVQKLTDYILEESYPDAEGWYRLGMVLRKMGQFDKAEDIYHVLLDQASDDENKAPVYDQLGLIKDNQAEYEEALTFCEKSLAIRQKTLPTHHPDLATSYNNIGNAHYSMGNYPKALSSHEKALEIRQQSPLPNHSSLADSYNNIGNVHYKMGNYPKALSSHEKALEIRQQSHPPSPTDLAMSYNNLGNVHDSISDYPKALFYYENALEIRQQSLPSNHPDLAVCYGNIGSVYAKMGNYPKALSSYEKTIEIQQQSLPSNHPDLAACYNNTGIVHYYMGNYPKALSYHEKATEIQQQSLPSNHPGLAVSYGNIGNVHAKMGNYAKALSVREKAVEIQQQSLPPNHPDLAASYNNIGNGYYNMGNYPKALSYHEKALEIKQKSLPPNHPDLALSYNNIGAVYENMSNFSKARTFYKHAIKIGEQSLPSNHSNLLQWRKNLKLVKNK